MNDLWFIPAIASLFGAASQFGAADDMKSLAREQELIAEDNALLEQRELDENVRRQKLQDAQVRGTALSRAAASGRRVEGSLQNYLTFIGTEQERELDWTRTAGASRIRLNLQTARNQARSLRIQAKSKKTEGYLSMLTSLSYLEKGGLFKTGTPSKPGININSSSKSGGSVGATASVGRK